MKRTSTSILITDPAKLRQHIGKCVLLIFKSFPGIESAYESLLSRQQCSVTGRWDLGTKRYGVFALEGDLKEFIAWLAEIKKQHEVEISVDDSPETRKLLNA